MQRSSALAMRRIVKKLPILLNVPLSKIGDVISGREIPKPLSRVNYVVKHEQRRAKELLRGILNPGTKYRYSIEGEEFEVHNETLIIGELRFGARASARLMKLDDGKIYAASLMISP
ncbi:hypothetical protein JNK13_02930 [bacterium]|nr:hypothetical protein [bacterium]